MGCSSSKKKDSKPVLVSKNMAITRSVPYEPEADIPREPELPKLQGTVMLNNQIICEG